MPNGSSRYIGALYLTVYLAQKRSQLSNILDAYLLKNSIVIFVKLLQNQCRSICIFLSPTTIFMWESQFYIQLVFKAPLCITLTISDQKIVSGSLFLTEKKIFTIFFFKFTFYCIQQSRPKVRTNML